MSENTRTPTDNTPTEYDRGQRTANHTEQQSWSRRGLLQATGAATAAAMIARPAAAQTDANPVEIGSWDALQTELANATPDDEFVLVTDLSAASPDYPGTGDDFEPISGFDGTFDGNGHTIADLTIEADGNNLALFGDITPDGLVRDVILEAVTIRQTGAGDRRHAGGLFGVNRGEVTRTVVTGRVSSNSTSGESFAPGSRVGGLGGNCDGGEISECAADVTIDAPDGSENGGLVGILWNEAEISDSYALGSVNGRNDIGALVGILTPGGPATLRRSYGAGDVSGDATNNGTAGGIVGYATGDGTITETYWDRGTTNQPDATGADSSVGPTADENGYPDAEDDDRSPAAVSDVAGFGATVDTTPAAAMQGESASDNMDALGFDSGTWVTVVEGDSLPPTPAEDGYPVLQAVAFEPQLGMQETDADEAPPEAGPFTVSALEPTDVTVTPGEDVTLTATITNEGSTDGDTPVAAVLDGAEVTEETLTNLDANDNETVDFVIEAPEDPGDYTHGVRTADDESTGTLTVEAPQNDGEVALTIDPATQQVPTGGTATLDIVVEGADNGLGAYEFTVTVTDTSVVEITTVTETNTGGTGETTVAEDGSQATFNRALLNDSFDPAAEITIGSVTVTTGDAADGATDLTLDANSLGDAGGTGYTVDATATATVETIDAPDVTGNGQPATDPDGDGKFEDINGDGSSDVLDVQALFQNSDADAVQNTAGFDFNDDGSVDVLDVQALFQQL